MKNDNIKVITFGELMLRLTPPQNLRIIQTKTYNSCFAGSEANVAVSLRNLGVDSSFITSLPTNNLGIAALSQLRFYGVNTTHILQKNGRLGIFLVEEGYSQRASTVLYDRENSVFSKSKKDDFNWSTIFESYDWFHFSGITPALSEELADICETALIEAKRKGLNVSCDLNYRSKLWDKNNASLTMRRYMPYIDVLIGNEEDAKTIFGYDYTNDDSKEVDISEYERIMVDLHNKYRFKKIYFTLRESINSNINEWSSVGYDGLKLYKSRKYSINVLDRLGAGDSFSASIIYGEVKKFDTQHIIDFATASSCLKHSIHEDFNNVSVEEICDLLNGISSGRIKR